MVDRGEDGAFWPSYVDLMTSLFVVALVLFVFSYKALSAERDRLRISAENYRRLQEIESAIKELADKEHFEYQSDFKRYVLKRQVQFAPKDATIDSKYEQYLIETGGAIEGLVNRLRTDPTKKNIRYLIVIEGMASRDSYFDNFGLSYRRALALYSFWKAHNIAFDPGVCEVLVAGSGIEGVGRYTGEKETLNQRFLIQIIPKVAYGS